MAPQSDDLHREEGHNPGDREGGQRATRQVPDRGKFTVVTEQNAHGALTIRDPESCATYHVVSYARPELRDRAEQLDRGTTVELHLSRDGGRANVWRVDQLSVPSG